MSPNDAHMKLLQEQLDRLTPGSKAHTKVQSEMKRIKGEYSNTRTRTNRQRPRSTYNSGAYRHSSYNSSRPPRGQEPADPRDAAIAFMTAYAAVGGYVLYRQHKENQRKKEAARAKAAATRKKTMAAKKQAQATGKPPATSQFYYRKVNGKMVKVKKPQRKAKASKR